MLYYDRTNVSKELILSKQFHRMSVIFIFDYKNANYCCIISAISKSEATKLLQNIDLTEKSGIL